MSDLLPPEAVTAAVVAIHRETCEWDLDECVADQVHDRAARGALEAAELHIRAAEQARICQLMSEEAERLTRIGHPQHGSALRNFAELIGERERQLQQVWAAIRDGAQ